jgi:Zn-dependent metalloprotease
MKKLFVTSALLALSLPTLRVPATASPSRSEPRVVRARGTNAPLYVTGLHVKPIGSGAVKAAKEHLRDHASLYHIPVSRDSLDYLGRDRIGRQISVRFRQKFEGVPVFGAQYVLHMKKTVDGYAAKAANGHYFTSLDAPTKPKLTVREAKVIARGVARPVIPTIVSSVGMSILPIGRGVLVYEFSVWGQELGLPAREEVFVNARTGAPVLSFNNLQGNGPVTGSGERADGQDVPLHVFERTQVGFEMRDRFRAMYTSDGGEITTHDVAGLRSYFGTRSNIVRSDSSRFDGRASDSGAVDAHWAAGQVYEFYRALGRNSINDHGSSIVSSVAATEGGQPLFNAFWDGRQMVYGNPDPDQLYPLSAGLDVVGHELTHGVTQYSAELVYLDQSGAMNEAYSDYFGNAIDNTVNPSKMDDPEANGYLGEDLCRVPAPTDGWECPTRDMNDGSDVSDYVAFLGDFDNGGVHVNMTIYSGALWDIRQALYGARGVDGAHDADRYVYAALTQYDTPLDTFVDGRNAVLTAARALGASDEDVAAIEKAFDDRGIVRGWDKGGANDSTVLLEDVSPQGFLFYSRPQVSGSKYVIGDYVDKSDICCKPMELLVGKDDGTGTPASVGEERNPETFSQETPDVSGERVVWARGTLTGSSGFDFGIRSRRIGQRVETVTQAKGFQWLPSIDGETVAYESATRAGTDVWARRGRRAPELVAGGKGEQWMPEVGGHWISWWNVARGGRRLGVGVKNLVTGRSYAYGSQRRNAIVGPPALGPGYVTWYEDADGDGTGAIMRARLGEKSVHTIVPETSDDAPEWHQVSMPPWPSGNANYVTYSDERSFVIGPNGGAPAPGSGRDVWIAPIEGGQPQLVTSNVGDQAYPQMGRGRTVLFLDTSQAETDLMSRRVPR